MLKLNPILFIFIIAIINPIAKNFRSINFTHMKTKILAAMSCGNTEGYILLGQIDICVMHYFLDSHPIKGRKK